MEKMLLMLSFRRDGQRSETNSSKNIKHEQNNRVGKSALLTVWVIFRIKNSFRASWRRGSRELWLALSSLKMVWSISSWSEHGKLGIVGLTWFEFLNIFRRVGSCSYDSRCLQDSRDSFALTCYTTKQCFKRIANEISQSFRKQPKTFSTATHSCSLLLVFFVITKAALISKVNLFVWDSDTTRWRHLATTHAAGWRKD